MLSLKTTDVRALNDAARAIESTLAVALVTDIRLTVVTDAGDTLVVARAGNGWRVDRA
jgi:hypothetical protein